MDTTNPTKHGSRFIDLTGQTFGQWTVLSETAMRGKHIYWACRCRCGTESEVATGALRRGRSRCCTHCRVKTHGLSKTPEYTIWRAMRARCSLVTSACYRNYGGRGITVCDEWESFETFYQDMGPRPSPKHTIERVDNSLGYSKDNCVWATRDQQLRNTRRNRFVTFNGKTMCVAEWARHLGLNYKTLQNRIKRGWPIERALSEPAHT